MNRLRNILLSNKPYIILIFLILIYSLIITTFIKHKSSYSLNETKFKLKIIEYKIDGNKLSLTLSDKENLVGTYYIKTEEEKDYLINNLHIGEVINLEGNLKEPSNNTIPYSFNYKKYLYNKKIYYILDISKIEKNNVDINVFYKIKDYMYKRVDKLEDNDYVYAFLLGKTYNIETNVVESYRNNGISHLFALSGLHVSIFSLFIMKILKKLKINELKRYIITFLFLLLFSFISGFSPSILRASLLFFLLGLNKVFYLNIKTENIMYLVLFILLLINPYNLYNLSFILSFTTTYFLIISTDLINEKNYFKGLFKTSLLSFVSNLILSIYYFGYINPFGILLNMIFVPLVTYIIFPLTIITYILPILLPILKIFTNIMEFLSLKLSLLSIKIYFPKISIIIVFIYYILLLISIKKHTKKLIPILILLIIYIYIKPYFSSNAYIYYLDVGQGDSTLIVMPHLSKTILIDTGGKINYKTPDWKKQKKKYSIAKDSIIPFMRKLGINRLDYLILTHGDYDHMGEASDIVDNFKVKNVIFNCGEYNSLEINLINKLNKDYYTCIDKINLDNLTLSFLNTNEYDNENDDSSVIKFDYYNYKFLFMGDASIKREKEILNLYDLNNIDFLKVGHHGSDTSSSKGFIDIIKPKYSIISVGRNNRYGHPNGSVLDILNNSKIYRTDLNGSIEIKINKNGYKIKTYSPLEEKLK